MYLHHRVLSLPHSSWVTACAPSLHQGHTWVCKSGCMWRTWAQYPVPAHWTHKLSTLARRAVTWNKGLDTPSSPGSGPNRQTPTYGPLFMAVASQVPRYVFIKSRGVKSAPRRPQLLTIPLLHPCPFQGPQQLPGPLEVHCVWLLLAQARMI